MSIAFLCPRCKCQNTTDDRHAGTVAVCEFCLAKVQLPSSSLANTTTDSHAPPGPPVAPEEIRADLARAKAEFGAREGITVWQDPRKPAPGLVDRGPGAVPPPKRMRRIKTGLEKELEAGGDFMGAAAGVLVGAAFVGLVLDSPALAAAGLAWADLEHVPRQVSRDEKPETAASQDFRVFVQAKRIDRHGGDLISRRASAGQLSDAEMKDLRTAVQFACYLTLCLMEDAPSHSRKAWSEFATRFGTEPAYDLTYELLVETDLVSTTLLGPVLRRWHTAAKTSRLIPDDMAPAAKKRKPRRPLPRRHDFRI